MSEHRIDVLARALGALADRRTATRTLTSGALGMVALLAGFDADAKKKKKKGKKKKKTSGKPQCTGTLQACPDGCVDLSSDEDNCGACGKLCQSGETCEAGVCRCGAAGCGAGFTCCGGDCVDTATDEENCGACGEGCAASETCEGGVCLCSETECGAGLTCCFGKCVDTGTDAKHCGTCRNRCELNESCVAGACMCGQFRCGDSFTCCEGGAGCICAAISGSKFSSPVGACTVISSCPEGSQPCEGPEGTCRTCCPANSTCDASRGVCLPATS